MEILFFRKLIIHGEDQQKKIDQIITSGRNLEIAVDGQCDTPGHNAT